MAVTRASKEEELQELERAFKGTDSAILVDYKGLKVPEVTELRRQIRKARGTYKVVKNTLAKRALKDTPFAPLGDHFVGTTAVAYSGDDPVALAAWQRGKTGYPIVDAAMRELWRTGFMPNRARMIVASFLVKHLLIPRQQGADWFLDTLVDADLANNSASWQWVSGCGTDAAISVTDSDVGRASRAGFGSGRAIGRGVASGRSSPRAQSRYLSPRASAASHRLLPATAASRWRKRDGTVGAPESLAG